MFFKQLQRYISNRKSKESNEASRMRKKVIYQSELAIYPQYDLNTIKKYCKISKTTFRETILCFGPNQFDNYKCVICLEEEPRTPSTLKCCNRIYCHACIKQWWSKPSKTNSCPTCRAVCPKITLYKAYANDKLLLKRIVDMYYLMIKIRLERMDKNKPKSGWLAKYLDECKLHSDKCTIDRYCGECNKSFCSNQVDSHKECTRVVNFFTAYMFHKLLVLNIMIDLEEYIKQLKVAKLLHLKSLRWSTRIENTLRRVKQGPSIQLDQMRKLLNEMKYLINYAPAPELVKRWPDLRKRLVAGFQGWPYCTYSTYEPLIGNMVFRLKSSVFEDLFPRHKSEKKN